MDVIDYTSRFAAMLVHVFKHIGTCAACRKFSASGRTVDYLPEDLVGHKCGMTSINGCAAIPRNDELLATTRAFAEIVTTDEISARRIALEKAHKEQAARIREERDPARKRVSLCLEKIGE